MNIFTVVLLCIQACLVQNVFGQCTSRAAVAAEPGLIAPGLAAPYGLGAPYGLSSSLAYGGQTGWEGMAPDATLAPVGYRTGLVEPTYPAAGYAGVYPVAGLAPYGGAGEGNVAVAGELPVVGSTVVAAQVPIMGAVSYGGAVPAGGSVSIAGQCACGCGAPYEFLY